MVMETYRRIFFLIRLEVRKEAVFGNYIKWTLYRNVDNNVFRITHATRFIWALQ